MQNTLLDWKNDSLIIIKKLINLNVPLVSKMEQNGIREILELGLNIRLYILQENIIGIDIGLVKKNHIKLIMEINSFYFHLKGILDNLASIICEKYNFKIKRSNIDLNKTKFKNALKLQNTLLYNFIEENSNWLDEITNKRNPIAHRKPLYIAPGIITSQEEDEKLKDIYKKLEIEKNPTKIFELSLEIEKVVKFYPYMIQHDTSVLEHIEETLFNDLQKIEIFNITILESCEIK